MTKVELEGLLDAVSSRAESLRAGGVRSLKVGEVTIVLNPPEPTMPVDAKPANATGERVDPMHDPATYGLPPGSKVPGLAWVRDLQESQDRRVRELGTPPLGRKG